MASVYFWLVVWCIVASRFFTSILGHHSDHREEWVVRIEGGSQIASLLALQSGYKHLGPVLGFKDTYVWLKDDSRGHKKRGGLRLTKALNSSTKIIWADQQKAIERYKRDYISLSRYDPEKPLIREKRLELDQYRLNSVEENDRNWQEYEPDDSKFMFNDELWDQEWYLQDTRLNTALPKLDLNVLPLYRLGVTGRGVKIAVLDDGLEYTHDDLRNNYDPSISYDVNEGDDDPLPRYESSETNGHGTRCAGEIAMEANNRKCGVGVAFEASVGGIKLLDGLVNDRVEGEALGYKPELVDIYTASWGPADDGKSLKAPGRLAAEALEKGITTATTDLRNTCTTRHTGTSASAPLAAGILALALQVNKDLTWRDVQHLIVWTSEYSPLRENPGWFRNSAGFWFNSRFGFGLMNAYTLVTASSNWTTVPGKIICKVDVSRVIDKRLAYGDTRKLRFETEDECRSTGNEITFLEHVEIEVSLEYSLRGALQMHLTAPSGTNVQLLKPRRLDNSDSGFESWKFMSVASWGEDPRGTWTLDILDEIGPKENNGTIEAFALILHGTREPPEYRKNGPRIYDQNYNRIRKTDEFIHANRPIKPVFEEEHNKLDSEIQEATDIDERDWWDEFL
ncbi:neuroendocrine convertase 1 isoform X3 [Osmia lignaria lignaria]|uniref:neuroendocrine convertase 1 isoform X3 n=1 Tax=Osmia lignaria lignaria TaxID=1437193 RepID=UPI00402B45F3